MLENKLKFDFAVMQKIINYISYIDSFKSKWEGIAKKENRYLKELRRIATVESIGSSTRIEGSKMTNEEIAALLKNLRITKFETRDEQEVVGYYQVLEIIFNNFPNIDITENYIKQLHGILLKESEKDQSHKGEYKHLSNKVVANYPGGTQKILFETTEPYLTAKEMNELINWINEKSGDKSIHPLIIISLFIYEFLSIHPFQDGNGRLSRLLTTLLMLKNGYDFVQYISFEHIIENRKAEYYSALISAQQYRNTDKEIIVDWALFFLSCLEELIKKLGAKYDPDKVKGGYLNDRQKTLLDYIGSRKAVKFGDIKSGLSEFSENTLKKDIQYLIAEGFIDKIGLGKATVYKKS